jgi:thiol-disulfide isomerase/thioredoxin
MMMIKILIISLTFCVLHANAQQADALQQRLKTMNAEKDPQKNVAAMHNTIRMLRLDPIQHAEEIDVLNGTVALTFLKAGNHAQFETYIGKIKNKFNQTSYLNLATFTLVGLKQIDYAAVIAKETVDRYESFKDDPSARPAQFPLADWNRFMQMAAYPYYERYAALLHLKGENKKALYYEEKAIAGQQDPMESSTELYATLLVADGQVDKAYALLINSVGIGTASHKMNALFEQLAVQKLGSQAKVALLLDSLQRNANRQYHDVVLKNRIANQDAPPFALRDLNGKTVSLSDFKGKIVVLDFWATWCAPCIAAMPAMQEMTKKHPEVVFLFIATQETGTSRIARVANYVKTNQFPIHVLIDEPADAAQKIFAVANAYKVTGIPTKVVIDAKGKLRFITSGYSSDAALINELTAMIAIAAAQ